MRKKKNTKSTKRSAPHQPPTPLAPPIAEKSSAARPTRKRTSKKRSVRYSPGQQVEILQFVKDYNAKNGRASQASASKKYGVSALTIAKWLKSSGKPAKKKAQGRPGRPGRPATATKSQHVAEGTEGT